MERIQGGVTPPYAAEEGEQTIPISKSTKWLKLWERNHILICPTTLPRAVQHRFIDVDYNSYYGFVDDDE
jgi:hypothetical protein